MKEIKQWLRSAIPGSEQPSSPTCFLFFKLPLPPYAVLLAWRILVFDSVSQLSQTTFSHTIIHTISHTSLATTIFSHTSLSTTISPTPLCPPSSLTHLVNHPSLTHFHTHLCQPSFTRPSLTHIFCQPSLPPPLSQTSLSTTISPTHPLSTTICHTWQVWHLGTSSFVSRTRHLETSSFY